jgi:DNA mismatch repair ATPase MutS
MQQIIGALDPDGSRLPRFYLRDSYSAELASLRARLKALPPEEETRAGELFAACAEEEERVREQIGKRLRVHHRSLADAFEAITRLDALLAKARAARETGACRPRVVAETTRYEGLFHPQVREALRARGWEFQPVDVAFGREPCLITGANMGGKTVLLKSVALAQALFQFGFHAPAARAEIVPVEKLFLSMRDGQDELQGLSSFASEILRVNEIIRDIREGKEVLALMDEPARGTNPTEGAAIVNALADILSRYRTRSLITTHYDGARAPCRRLRVKGLDGLEKTPLTPGNLRECMDYSLVEVGQEDAPREAARVAEMLGADAEIIEKIKQYMPHE